MIGNKKIGELLIELGFITAEQLNAALLHQKEFAPRKKIGEILVELGFLNEIDLLKCLSGLFKLRYISSDKLLKMAIPQWVLDIIPVDLAEKYRFVPFFCYDKSKTISVAIADPQDKQLPKLIKKLAGVNEIESYVALESAIKAAIAKFYKHQFVSVEQFKAVIKSESPQTIASFVPKTAQEIIEPEFVEPSKLLLKSTKIPEDQLLYFNKTKVYPFNLAESESQKQRRLSDQIAPLSLMSEDTFIELLNVLINILEIYKGGKYRGHSASVAKLVKEISQNLGLKAKETYYQVLAAYLHDCGMHTSEHLTLLHFNSENKLEMLKKYSRSALRLYEGVRLPVEVEKILLHTFERYDGEGFPEGLKGEEIPLGSRIIATVDAFIHLVNFESYGSFKGAFDLIASFQEKYFDPKIVDILGGIIADLFIDESSPRIIIIDHQPQELENLAALLKKNGFFPYPLKDTEKVIALLDNNPIYLVISEVATKPIDGFSICKLIKTNKKYQGINFIFLSHQHDHTTISKGFEAGADDFIAKPYNPNILIAKVKNFIKSSHPKTEKGVTPKGITGNLAEIQVTDLIQMLGSGRKSGTLKLFKEEEKGKIFFDQGQVINACYQDYEGEEAFNLLIRWEHGLFVFDPDAPLSEQKIFANTEMLLIEACRMWDEDKKKKEELL